MDREKIIKALECYTNFNCGECPLDCAKCEEFDCVKQTLSLIKELTEENEGLYRSLDDKIQENKRLTEHNAQILQFGQEWEALARKFEAKNKKLAEENEGLQSEERRAFRYLAYGDVKVLTLPTVMEIKADTIRKMQTMFAVHFGTYTENDTVKIKDVFRLLDQIAKEMIEE